MVSVAAGGLIGTYINLQENLDITYVSKKRNIFVLKGNGDSMTDACITYGDVFLIESITNSYFVKTAR